MVEHMQPITIRIAGENEHFSGSFVVEQGDRSADGMGWDEMLGHVIALTLTEPSVKARLTRNPPGLYGMLTREERDREIFRRDEDDGA